MLIWTYKNLIYHGYPRMQLVVQKTNVDVVCDYFILLVMQKQIPKNLLIEVYIGPQ